MIQGSKQQRGHGPPYENKKRISNNEQGTANIQVQCGQDADITGFYPCACASGSCLALFYQLVLRVFCCV